MGLWVEVTGFTYLRRVGEEVENAHAVWTSDVGSSQGLLFEKTRGKGVGLRVLR